MLRTLEEECAPGEDPVQACRRHVLQRPGALLVFDSCEHVIDEVVELAVALLEGGPPVRVIATSREPLHAPGEQLMRVDPLPIEPDASRS